jgi:uncharacterized protein
MTEFSKQISEKWNISPALAEKICVAFEQHDTPYYLAEYEPEIAVELQVSSLWEIYDFLKSMEELSSKKKRVLNALKKADKVTPTTEKRVNLTSNPFELDDMLIPLRPNARSKGQLASKKGLEPLADLIMKQTEEVMPVEDMAAPYVGKDPTLTSASEVLQGVKDLLAERFSSDETVRVMVREFACDDGFFEITPKNKKDPDFAHYVGKFIPIQEFSKEEFLKLMVAEDLKNVRVKLGVQLFRITELIRHHFIENPDSVGFDLICETIDDSWLRILQPVIERDVKERLRTEAEDWVSKLLVADLNKKFADELKRGPVLVADASNDKNINIIALNGQGEFLGSTTERKPPEGKNFSSDRLRQFVGRHKPTLILLQDNAQADLADTILKHAATSLEQAPQSVRFTPDTSVINPAESEWLKKEFSTLLDEELLKLYGNALTQLQPISLIPKVGTGFFKVHPFQALLPQARFIEIISRITVAAALEKGVSIKEINDSALSKLSVVTPEILQAIRTFESQTPLVAKTDLLKVNGMTESVYRNIAGFLVIPNAEELIDRTLVHPNHMDLILDIGEELTASTETIVTDPDVVRSYLIDDPLAKIYIEKKLISQLLVGKKYLSQQAPKVKRKLKLNELKEGAIVSGKVTNITQFGVFVNINAVCDGLIHISQLADEYVETPDQVVKVNDKVDVRILKVDVKKRRISLSMKNLGNKAPKVRPSQGQLDNLAEFFKNR